MGVLLGLGEIRPADRARVGGKAAQLGQMARLGLAVPSGLVVTTAAFHRALLSAGAVRLAEQVHRSPTEDHVAALRRALAEVKPGPLLRRRLVWRARSLGERVAVRSSSLDEDGRSRSYAGQHETILHVAPEDVPDAVARCWASLYSDAAMAYRRVTGRGPAPGSMAVVVQRMVEPVVSGVMFTVNPLTGSWREMTVEATWGLGEGLVSGQVTPHWYLVRRPRKAPRPVQRALARVRLQVVQRDLPEIEERWTLGEHGKVVRRPTPPSLRGRETLSASNLYRLCRMGLRVEGELGEPQDVEWAMDRHGQIFLLQTRPITTTGAPRVRKDVLWTRRFIGERWPEPATPLGWSLLAPVFEHFIGYPKTQARYLGGGPPLRLVRSRPYLNASAFRHLSFKLPGAPSLQFMLELIPPEEERQRQRRFGVLPDLSVYASFFRETFEERRWRRFRWNPFLNHLQWDAFEERLQETLPALARTPSSEADAVVLMDEQLDFIREYTGLHVCSLLFANLFYQLLESALSNWIPARAADLMQRLAVSPPGNRTVETNAALFDLAAVATEADLTALAAGDRPDEGTDFGRALTDFLARYGHRSHASWEVMSPRWLQEPERLVPVLRAQAQVEPEDSARRIARQVRAYEAALSEVRGQVRGGERLVLEGLIHYTRRYLLLRENQRFEFDRVLFAVQRTALWVGESMVARGVLETPWDIAYLTWDEVRGLVSGALSADPVGDWVGRRRAQREEDAREEPPIFLRGDEGVAVAAGESRLQGLGISPGRARGKVRIVRSMAESHRLVAGEILVAHAVDPGWTPLMLSAGGVILEMGSRLSHGAVVAREYGLPAVVNIEGVLRRLHDGQEVTVDGTRGVVWIHP